MPVQGTAADIMKLAMIKTRDAMVEQTCRSTMILQVHDELVFEVPPEEIDRMAAIVHTGMSTAIELSVPLAVDVRTGPNWGSLSAYEFAA
jgi:DNA polymerase-1